MTVKIEAVGIIGANPVGTGLAEIMVGRGYQVRLFDVFRESLKTSVSKVNWALAKGDKRGLSTNLEPVQDLGKFEGADIVIETDSGTEDRPEFFKRLGEKVSPSCVIAARAGVNPISALDLHVPNPERFIGFHFFLPVRKNKLVEAVRTERTGDGVLELCVEFIRNLEKTPVIVKDNPGVIVERLMRPFILSGIRLLETGNGLPSGIDSVVKSVGGLPLGPLETADIIGLDTDMGACQAIFELLGNPRRLEPSKAENRLVQYGQLGKKTTAGFYLYEDGEIVGENPALQGIIRHLGIKDVPPEEIFGDVMRPVVEEARLLAGEVMASELDIETAVKLGLGWPKGPFAFLREMEPILGRKKEVRSTEWD